MMERKNILFIGLGLISGSLFKNFCNNDKYNSYVYDINENTCNLAKKDNANIVDNLNAVKKIDFEFICLGLYPNQNKEFVKSNLDFFANRNVFDVAGLQNIWFDIKNVLTNNNINYVATHPMCGREVSGYENSLKNLFESKTIVINSISGNKEFYNKVINIYKDLNSIIITNVEVETHDKIVTYTSQLPHVISLAYTRMLTTYNPKEIKDVSSNSFQEFSRISNVNEKLWSKLFIDNAYELEQDIDELILNLQTIKKLISSKKVKDLDSFLNYSKENINLVNKK